MGNLSHSLKTLNGQVRGKSLAVSDLTEAQPPRTKKKKKLRLFEKIGLETQNLNTEVWRMSWDTARRFAVNDIEFRLIESYYDKKSLTKFPNINERE